MWFRVARLSCCSAQPRLCAAPTRLSRRSCSRSRSTMSIFACRTSLEPENSTWGCSIRLCSGMRLCGPADIAAQRRFLPQVRRRLSCHIAGVRSGQTGPRSLFHRASRLRENTTDGEIAGQRHRGAAAIVHRCLACRSRWSFDAVETTGWLGAPDRHAVSGSCQGRPGVVAAVDEPHRPAQRRCRACRRLLRPSVRHRDHVGRFGPLKGIWIGRLGRRIGLCSGEFGFCESRVGLHPGRRKGFFSRNGDAHPARARNKDRRRGGAGVAAHLRSGRADD